jgi:hypothetical protein
LIWLLWKVEIQFDGLTRIDVFLGGSQNYEGNFAFGGFEVLLFERFLKMCVIMSRKFELSAFQTLLPNSTA